MEKKEFEPRKPDSKGFVVGKDGKADFGKPHCAIWFNDADRAPEKPFTMISNGTPKKVRFFPMAEVEQAQNDYEEARKIVQAKREQGESGSVATPVE